MFAISNKAVCKGWPAREVERPRNWPHENHHLLFPHAQIIEIANIVAFLRFYQRVGAPDKTATGPPVLSWSPLALQILVAKVTMRSDASMPTTRVAPPRAAKKLNTPVPQPTSRTVDPRIREGFCSKACLHGCDKFAHLVMRWYRTECCPNSPKYTIPCLIPSV